jgi:methylmalonyl-CoA/ethylmalonyl-CoA epimerase
MIGPVPAVYDLGELHHVGIVVPDLEDAAATVRRLYDLPVTLFGETTYECRIDGTEHTTRQRIGLSAAGPPHIELLRAVPGSPVWTPAPGVHHLGFVVDDVPTASSELARRGARLWMAGTKDGRGPVGTCYHRDPLGQVIELLDRAAAARLAGRLHHHSH